MYTSIFGNDDLARFRIGHQKLIRAYNFSTQSKRFVKMLALHKKIFYTSNVGSKAYYVNLYLLSVGILPTSFH